MQILLLQDRAEVREKIGFFLESTYGVKVQEASSFAHSIELVKSSQPGFDLIILDIKLGNLVEQEEFWAVTHEIPMVLCSQGSPDGAAIRGNVVGVVDRDSFMDDVVSVIDGLIKQGVLSEKRSDQNQVRIRAKLLLSVCPLKGDIYIRLSKSKFVKLFREGDAFDFNDLEKYTIKKGVEYLYIRQEQCAEFAEKYREELQKLLKSDHLLVEEVGKLGESVHETVQELSSQIGFTKEVQELTRTHVQLTVKSMGRDPELADILKKLKATEGRYISSHSTLCAYISCALAAQLQWGSDTTFFKLTLASFMHDMTLVNHDLAALNSLEELEKESRRFTAEEIQAFKDHPVTGAEMIKRMTEVPPDVDTIVRQHHERPDGNGFPRKLSHSYIAPLATVFILSHDLTQFVLKSGENFDVQIFLNEFKDKYKSSKFKKVMGCIEVLHKTQGLSEVIQVKS